MLKKKKKQVKQVFYAIIIGFAVISFWRGIWGLLDLYLIPENPLLSHIVSILVGVLILYFTKHLFDELM